MWSCLILVALARMRIIELSAYVEKSLCLIWKCFTYRVLQRQIKRDRCKIPAGYIEAYKQFTHKDSHVLALAYKLLPDMPVRFSLFHARNCANCLRIFMTVEKQFVSWWTCDLILHQILIKLVAQRWHSVSNNKEAAVITGTCMIFMQVGKAWVLECEMVEVNSSLQDLWYVYNIGCCGD